ncbi:GTP cyclohydrolase I FolE [Facklamia hominis]|uniref:GTP cyclohydrolase I FolE n=1 Tax=Facklamia hominis TaxID=178214 RepID=UPI0029D4121C|nr:GTP cyclohydrolase I FolE [Facklamia hominis]WPJ90017.1 GTP cyclohydrolase I FolE [Facklamia hominis]
MKEMNLSRVEELVREILIEIGEDPDRDGLIETPKRVAKALAETTASTRLTEFSEGKMFPTEQEDDDQFVSVNNIPFYSMCEHHMLPFFGQVSVAYLPQGGKIIGLSKIPRLVDYVSKKLNVQENITREVANILMEVTNARGVAVIVDARHMCVEMRGVKKMNSITRTSYYVGEFKENIQLRNEFLQSLPKVN